MRAFSIIFLLAFLIGIPVAHAVRPTPDRELCVPAKIGAWQALPKAAKLEASLKKWAARQYPKLKDQKIIIMKAFDPVSAELAKRYAQVLVMEQPAAAGSPMFSGLVDRQAKKVLPYKTCAEFNKSTGMLGPRWRADDKTALQVARKYLNFVHQLKGAGPRGHIRGFPGNVPPWLKAWANKDPKQRMPLLTAPTVKPKPKGRWSVDIRSWDKPAGRLYREHLILDRLGRITSHKRNVLGRLKIR